MQAVPQLPQLLVVVKAVSQPLLGLPSQSPYPAAQVGLHVPLMHAVVPWALVQVMALLHAPQWHEPGKVVPGRVPPGQAFRLFGFDAGPHVQQRPLHMAASLVHALALVVLAPNTLAQNLAQVLLGTHLAARTWPRPASMLAAPKRAPTAVAANALSTWRREVGAASTLVNSSKRLGSLDSIVVSPVVVFS